MRSLISFSNSSIGGSANPFSMEATTRADHGARRNGEAPCSWRRPVRGTMISSPGLRHDMKAKSTASEPPVVTMISSGGKLDLILLVIGHQLFAQRAVAVAGAVFQHLAVDVFEGFETLLGRGRSGWPMFRW